MPLSTQHQKYWDIIRPILLSTLTKRFPPDTTARVDRRRLISLVQSCIEENTNETSLLMRSFVGYASELDGQYLLVAQYKSAVKDFINIPDVELIFDKLQDEVTKKLSTSSAALISPADFEMESDTALPDYSFESIQTSIKQWVFDRYSPTDERVLTSDNRRLRRMDSLSRLLSLNTSFSACTAVTLDIVSEPAQIVIGVNVGESGKQDIIATQIATKLEIIKTFLTTNLPSSSSSTDPSLEDLMLLAAQLVEKLMSSEATTSMPKELMLQAASKIIHAFCFDNDTFTRKEKALFTTVCPVQIILPSLKEEEGGAKIYTMKIRQLGTRTPTESYFNLPMIPKGTSVKEIHAEQLIARYLFGVLELGRIQKPDEPFVFGISKLCCRTCFEHIMELNVTVRGHHNQTYQGVVNLNTGDRADKSSERSATTFSWKSPVDTPYTRMCIRRGASEVDYAPRASGSMILCSSEALAGAGSAEADDKVSELGIFSRTRRLPKHPMAKSSHQSTLKKDDDEASSTEEPKSPLSPGRT